MSVKKLAIAFFCFAVGFNIIAICYILYFQDTEIVVEQGTYEGFTIGATKTQILKDTANANIEFSPLPKPSPLFKNWWNPSAMVNGVKTVFLDSSKWIVNSRSRTLNACPDRKKCSRMIIVFSENKLQKIQITCSMCR